MIQPDFKTFCKLARQGNLVPVYDTFTADTLTPVSAYQRLAHDARYACLLESVEGGEKIARYTFVGANPSEVFRYVNGACVLESESRTSWAQTNPLDYLRNRVERYRPVRVPGLPPLVAGAIGYFAYDMVRLVERIPDTGARRRGHGRRRDDVFSWPRRVRSRAASRVDRAQCFHRRRRQPAREIQSGCAGNPRHAPASGRSRLPPSIRSGARTRPLKVTSNFTRAKFLECRSQIEGIHPRGRYFSGGHQPAIRREDRRRSV